ncbi:nucleotide pyrophosphohydrolase [Vagococcus elongatus]
MQQLQKEVDLYIRQFEKGYFPPMSLLATLTEEVGELARELNHVYGDKQKKPEEPSQSIGEEIGDVLIAAIIMANSLEIDLTEVFHDNMRKFQTRDKDRFERKDKNDTLEMDGEGQRHGTQVTD